MRNKRNKIYITKENKRRIIFGTLLSLLSISLIVFGFSTMTSCSKAKPYQNIEDIDKNDFFTKRKDPYYIFFYSENCPFCEQIEKENLRSYKKDNIYKININANRNNYNIFDFSNEDECKKIDSKYENNYCTVIFENYETSMVGVSNIDDFILLATPTLISIDDQKIQNIYCGLNQIKEELV